VTLPGLVQLAGEPARLCVWKDADGTVLASVHDFLRWLRVDRNTWHHWLAEDFRKCSDVSGCELLLREDVTLAGERVPTPLTNFAGFRRLLVLCIQRSAVVQAVADEALCTLGRVQGASVGHRRTPAQGPAGSE
jgi:hypothetical protein